MKNTFHNEPATKAALIEFISSAEKLSMGEQCARFEQNFAKWQQRKHAVFVMNGSMANLVLIQALLNSGRLAPGDKVGFSAVTWSTNVMPLIQLGLEPVPIDCELDTLNVSSTKFTETLETENLKALFITNALGFADDINEIARICAEKNILLIEDNCESLGSVIGNTKLGNFGLAATFSTFVGHHMSTIEGGLICTDDGEFYEHLVMCRAHGWDRNLPPTKQGQLRAEAGVSDFFATYTFHELAYNARPTEIQGFLGNTQLKYLDDMIDSREKNFFRFLSSLPKDVTSLRTKHMSLVSNFAMPIICKDEATYQAYIERFKAAEVEIRPIIAGNMQRQPFYKKHIHRTYALPNSDHIHNYGFYFPNHPDLEKNEIDLLLDTMSL